jgi:CBS domain-containing protein
MPTVEDLMTKETVSADIDVFCDKAAKLMTKKGVGALIVNERGKPVGIVTERDFLKMITAKAEDSSKIRLGEIMSKPLVTIGSESTVREAAKLMVDKDIRRLVVVEDNDLIGIVTIRDITRLLIGSIAEWGKARVTIA